ncbi:MAG TPA: AAA family ATPase, partial [Puia sp.]|nr:AAA family ATPase [Puia sp.]
IQKDFNQIAQGRANGHVPQWLVIEGAGGLLVPLNGSSFIIDLVKLLKAKLLLVSRNYLGSINHSLLTARACREMNIPVEGWIFNCQYLDYENEIASWTGFRKIGSIPFHAIPDREFVAEQAKVIEPVLRQILDVKT